MGTVFIHSTPPSPPFTTRHALRAAVGAQVVAYTVSRVLSVAKN